MPLKSRADPCSTTKNNIFVSFYLGFVLGAMGTDYDSRLSAIFHDPLAATRLINDHTEVALLLCGLDSWPWHVLNLGSFLYYTRMISLPQRMYCAGICWETF